MIVNSNKEKIEVLNKDVFYCIFAVFFLIKKNSKRGEEAKVSTLLLLELKNEIIFIRALS